jgi:hypothetical protein
LWAGIASAIGTAYSRDLRDIDLIAAIYKSVSDIEVSTMPNFLARSRLTDENQEFRSIYPLVDHIVENIGFRSADTRDLIEQASRRAANGYRELVSRGLITDPIIETTLGIAVLSFIPFSIVKRTERGRVVYRRIRAAAWSYQRKTRSGGHVEMNLTFKVASIAGALKAGLVAAYNEAMKEKENDKEMPSS